MYFEVTAGKILLMDWKDVENERGIKEQEPRSRYGGGGIKD